MLRAVSKDVSDNIFQLDTVDHITHEGLEHCASSLFQVGDIILTARGSIGKMVIVGEPMAMNQSCYALSPKFQNTTYLYFLSKELIEWLKAKGSGSVFKSFNVQDVEYSQLCIAPTQIIERFCNSVNCLFSQIRENTKEIATLIAQREELLPLLMNGQVSVMPREVNRNLEAMARQLYDYWFVQFDFPDENGRPYKSSGGKMVWNEKLKREIPDGWSDGRLIDIANITMGQSPEGSTYNETGDGILFYQGSTDFGLRFPSVRQFTTAPTRFAKQGDILMSVRAPVGTTNIANADCCIGRGLAVLNSKIGSITHLYHIIQDLKTAFDMRNDAGTTFGSITKDDLYSLAILRPNASLMTQYEKLCSPIFAKQMLIGENINLLTKQRDELLPLLMNGQVSVMPQEVNCDLSHG